MHSAIVFLVPVACLAGAVSSAMAGSPAVEGSEGQALPVAASPAASGAAGGERDTSGANKPYHIGPDGKVGWPTYSGYRRFNGTCEVCHGPDGSGSSFGPDLTQSLQRLDYDQFAAIVAGGQKNVYAQSNSVMPSFGTNKNVMCYLDDIYAYLKARSDGALGRGRPPSHAAKPPEAAAAEKECMGS